MKRFSFASNGNLNAWPIIPVMRPQNRDFMLDFTSGQLPANVSLSRASSGARTNSAGQIELIGNDLPRFDYEYKGGLWVPRGLRIEPETTNVAVYSNDMTRSTLSGIKAFGSGSVKNAIASVVKDEFLSLLQEDSNTGQHQLIRYNIPVTAGNYYSLSFIAKAKERLFISATLSATHFANVSGVFNLGDGSYTQGSGAVCGTEYLGGGMHRCSVAGLCTLSAPNVAIYFAVGASSSSFSYAGDGVSGLYINHLQPEASIRSTSYVPTGATAVTRAADMLLLNVPSGCNYLTYTFDDASSQKVAVTTGAYTVPTNLNRPWIKQIQGSAA